MTDALDAVGGERVHVDIDADALDRAVALGCPASVPGGLRRRPARCRAGRGGTSLGRLIDFTEVDAAFDTADGRTRLVAQRVLEAIRGFEPHERKPPDEHALLIDGIGQLVTGDHRTTRRARMRRS